MRKSTLSAACETSPVHDGLAGRLAERVNELLAVVAAFQVEPPTPQTTCALEKK